jgi:hypothetical protein
MRVVTKMEKEQTSVDTKTEAVRGLKKQHREQKSTAGKTNRPRIRMDAEMTGRQVQKDEPQCKSGADNTRQEGVHHTTLAQHRRDIFGRSMDQEKCRPRKQWAAARMRMTHRTEMAWHRG